MAADALAVLHLAAACNHQSQTQELLLSSAELEPVLWTHDSVGESVPSKRPSVR
jgi:hypothetical protein